MKKKITILIVTIILVLLVLSTTTYALFFKQDKLEEEESYTAGILDIVLDNDEEGLGEVLSLANSIPLTDEEGKQSKPYKFKIKNIGNLAYTFDLKILSTTTENLINSNYIKVMIDDKEPVYLSSLVNSIIASNLTLNSGESKIISVRLWLDEYTPNTEIGKVFRAKIVGDGKGVDYVKPRTSDEMLQYLGLTAKEGTPDFSKRNYATKENLLEEMTTLCGHEDIDSCVYDLLNFDNFDEYYNAVIPLENDNGIYSANDDYGKSYYFRGTATNNYVKFAGFYWRIIRINGDGTIRMMYDGTSAHDTGESTEDRVINSAADAGVFNATYGDNAYVGYMMGIDNECEPFSSCSGTTRTTSYKQATTNTYSSNIKMIVDNWYKENLANTKFNNKIADVVYCNDRKISSGTGIGNVSTTYEAEFRISLQEPVLTCSQKNDAFTVNDTTKGNGALTYPVGLITADEVSMAGGFYDGTLLPNISYYLNTGGPYWTMTPSYSGSRGNMFYVEELGLFGLQAINFFSGIKPVISLKSNLEIVGTGSKENPFEVK